LQAVQCFDGLRRPEDVSAAWPKTNPAEICTHKLIVSFQHAYSNTRRNKFHYRFIKPANPLMCMHGNMSSKGLAVRAHLARSNAC